MPSAFDALVDEVDEIHQKEFAVDVLIDGEETKGIFSEEFDEFEGNDTLYITLEIPVSDLPEGTRKSSVVQLVDSGRLFMVTKPVRRDKLMTLVLAANGTV